MSEKDCGVFYVATGPRHSVLTCRAIETLLKTNPGMPVCVFTDDVNPFASIRGQLDQID